MATKHLRPSRLDEAKRDKLLAEVEKDRQRLNDAVAALAAPAIGIVVDDVETLLKISRDWLKQYLTDNYKAFVEASGFVPAATRQRVLDEYNQTGATAEPFAVTIETILKRRQGFPLKQDRKGHFWFDEKAVKAWATEQATRHFTEAQQRYYTLLGELFERLNELAAFERVNGMRPFAIHGRSWLICSTSVRRWYRDYFCSRDVHGDIVGDLRLTSDKFVEMIDREQLFPAK